MRKTNMPTARGFFTTSVINGKIYAIGGALGTGGPAFRTVEEYDPATDTWARKADLPEPRYLHAAGVVDGKIYIIAGSWQAYTASPAVYEYDPATDTWERKTDAPTVRSWLSASAVDGRIYVIGGDVPPKANVEEYDPATDTWTRRADMPTPRGALSTTALNGKIYVIGGTATTAYNGLSTVEEYYPNPLVLDFDGDEIVNFKDFSVLAQYWYQDQSPFAVHSVDYEHLAVLADYWLKEVLPDSLVAYWKLDETEGGVAHDSIGGEDGFGPPDLLWRPEDGKVGGALELDGIDDLLYTTFSLNPADTSFSVFAWVKGGAPGQVIISQAGGADWLLADPADGKLMTELRSSGRFGGPLKSQTVITDGAWHRVGLSWDGATRILYVDGIEVAKDTQAGLAGSQGGLQIGTGKNLELGSFFSGLIDDVRIYDRAVTP